MARVVDNSDYEAFLRAKVNLNHGCGFDVDPRELNPLLKPHQRDIVCWAARLGRAAIFASFGLGKTAMQLELARLIQKQTGGRFLITAPLGVRQEFRREGMLDTHEYRARAEALGLDHANVVREFGLPITFIRRTEEADNPGFYITNYESVRDGKVDPTRFDGSTLDEAAILRGFGSTKTFREFMRLYDGMRYKFVATATPSPNEYIELLSYAAYLEVMDVSQAKTRFFKRDSTKADHLELHPHKEREFWLWIASWAIFLQKPSDLGHSDEGYSLPPLEVHWHEVPSDHANAGQEPSGQGRLLRNAALGVTDAAREKRDSLPSRMQKLLELRAENPYAHRLLWHDLESERDAIEQMIPTAVSVYGSQDLEEREQAIIDFSDGKIQELAAKPILAGSGCNFQRHCAWEIFLGIGFKFNDFIQAVHRCHRFLQTKAVRIDLIYTEAEREIKRTLQRKWQQHDAMTAKMSEIIREFGLSHEAMAQALRRSMGVERVEITGDNYALINNDAVLETRAMRDNSVDLILTSIPFSTQYEYSPSYNDFGHTEDNEHFFRQMDFLTPELFRVLRPGRIAAIHVKDRIVPGGMTGLGFQTVYPFHMRTCDHFAKHGFAYMGMKTIVTDVVRENNQTYRLGWTEQCKDATKMGCGMPEYLLMFRKPTSDTTNSYADNPVVKEKKTYTRSRWQIDAHGFERSSGDRLLTPEEIRNLEHQQIFKLFREYSLNNVYDFEHHVALSESLERCRECGHIHTGDKRCEECPCTIAGDRLPKTFMLFQPPSWHPDVWTDVTRMRTLNGAQWSKGKELHLCPMQLDLADRIIAQYSMAGETVYDPFSGLGTVPLRALLLGRKGLGCELSPSYFADAVGHCESGAKKLATPSLFDTLESAEEVPTEELA